MSLRFAHQLDAYDNLAGGLPAEPPPCGRSDNPGPLPGDDWVLGAKGARGRPRERGRDGVHVSAFRLTGYTVTIELSDGQCLHVNLLPALRLYDSERSGGA